MKKVFMVVTAALLSVCNFGQTVDDVLKEVEKNNLRIKSARKNLEFYSKEAFTDIYPEDPKLEADYMIGRPVSGGNQFDFTATQEFDLPLVYKNRKKLAEGNILAYRYEVDRIRKEVLLQAKELMLESIHLQKRLETINTRLETDRELIEVFEEKAKVAEINLLELNKAKLHLLDINSDKKEVEALILINENHLSELNAGKALTFSSESYFDDINLPDLTTITDSLERGDPDFLALEARKIANEMDLSLTKSENLPKFETGYHYQSVLGQTFNGGHFGMSIPLWKNKNKLDASKLNIDALDARIQQHINEHNHHINQKYEHYLNLKERFQDYEKILKETDNSTLLQTLIKSGEIDFIRYADEVEYFFEAEDKMMEVELELHLTIAELLKYKL